MSGRSRCALRARLAGATLAVKSQAKDRANRHAGRGGTMKLAANLFAALLVLLGGADGIGAIRLSEPAGENPGRLHARHGSRPCGAHSCRPVLGGLGHALRDRECSRRRRQHRHRSRRQGGRRRLHAGDGRQRRRSSSIRACMKPCHSTRSRISRRSRKYSSRRTCSPCRPKCRPRPWRNWWRSPRRSPASFPTRHAGVGTSQHLAAELFKYMAHVDIAAGALSRHARR